MAKKSKSKKSDLKVQKGPQTKMVKAPTSTSNITTVRKQAPQVAYQSDGSCVVSHREYVREIDSSNANLVNKMPVNPQQTQMFKWLSAIASRFEMYRFEKLKFVFESSAATTTSGYFVIAFDFDAYDAQPTKQEMLVWKYSARGPLWSTTALNCTQDARLATYRYCDFSVRGDQRLDLLGNLFFQASSQNPGAVGELYVEYTCRFRQPSFKVPAALSWTRPFGDFSTGTVGEVVDIITNIPFERITNQIIRLYAVGQFLASFRTNGSYATDYSPPGVIVTGVEGGQVTSGDTATTLNTSTAITEKVFRILQAPADVQFIAPVDSSQAGIRIGTYFM